MDEQNNPLNGITDEFKQKNESTYSEIDRDRDFNRFAVGTIILFSWGIFYKLIEDYFHFQNGLHINILIVIFILFFYLIFQRWFWALVFFFCGLGSLFAMIASIIHFQILGALGFFVTMVISCIIFAFAAQKYWS